MRLHRLLGLHALAAMLAVVVSAPVQARDGPFVASAAVADRTLDHLRGGYVDTRGVFASFGIERTTTVNGQVVVSQSVRIADLSRATAADLTALRSIVGSAVVLQNTRNDQTIRNSVVVDATSNSLGLLQRAAAARAVNDALIAPLVRP